jgi:hypothetical protein
MTPLKNTARQFALTLAALFVLALAPAAASAANVYVETAGVDAPGCGATNVPASAACATISYATGVAVSGDEVKIGSGTFVQTVPVNPVAKSLTYSGSGQASTTVTSNSAIGPGMSATFWLTTAGRSYRIRDLTLTGFPGTASASRRAVLIKAGATSQPGNAIDVTIEDVTFVGLANPGAGIYENAVWSYQNNGHLTIDDCTTTDVMGNVFLLESQRGAVDITDNTINKPHNGVNAASYAIYDWLYLTNWPQSGVHNFSGNTINAPRGIGVVSGLSGSGPQFAQGVTFFDNKIDTGPSSLDAILLQNAVTNDPSGNAGRIDNVNINGNDISAGTGLGGGIWFRGLIQNPVVQSNNIRNRSFGVSLGSYVTPAVPTGSAVRFNQLVDNTVGVATDPAVSVTTNLNENWWGCNQGPSIGAAPQPDGDCDTVTTFDAGAITLANWVVLRLAATPFPKLGTAGVANLTAGFDQLNTGSPASPVFANGTLLPMSATGGNLQNPSPALNSSLAIQTFTSTAPAGRSASANFDHQTVTETWDDAPVVTIDAPANGLITSSASVTVDYTVTPSSGVTCNIPDGASAPLNPGANAIVVICTDSAGNSDYDNVSVIRDNTPPAVTIVSPIDGTTTGQTSLPLNFTVVNDYGSVNCDRTDGAAVNLVEGPNAITVNCTDQAGNVGSDTVTVTRDTMPPSVEIISPADNSTTTAATTTVNFLASDLYSSFNCMPADGASVALNFGINSIVVTCTDAVGNVGSDVVTVTRTSDVPPVVTITAPAPGATITASSATLTYNAASQDGTVSCTPASGTVVPLAVGINTLTVNCVDNFGNAASASVTVYHPDALPECARDVAITDVTRVGSRTRIRGVARLRFAGQTVKLQYRPTGSKTAGTATVRADGSFSAVVRRPSRPSYRSNSARYRALLGTTATAWVKVTRRMGATAVTYSNGRLTISGSVSKPLARGQRLRVLRSDACGAYRQIGSLTIRSSGSFKGSVSSGGAAQSAVMIRLSAIVGSSSNPRARSRTYSIVQPVVIER